MKTEKNIRKTKASKTLRADAPNSHERTKGGNRKKGHSTIFLSWPRWAIWFSGVLIVLFYFVIFYKFVTTDSFNWTAYYREPDYLEGYEVRGIDVSHHQGVIDWEKVRNARIGGAPITFVVIKATEGTDLVDPYFHRNISRARKAELITGAYHFFNPRSDPAKQARLFIRNVTVEEGDMRPVLDVEHVDANITTAEFQQRVLRWLHIVEKEYGVKPIIYTGRNFKQDYLNAKEFDDYPLWLAHYYVDEMVYPGKWALWQHTDCGQVKGIKGKVDCNIFNGNMIEFLTLTIRNQD